MSTRENTPCHEKSFTLPGRKRDGAPPEERGGAPSIPLRVTTIQLSKSPEKLHSPFAGPHSPLSKPSRGPDPPRSPAGTLPAQPSPLRSPSPLTPGLSTTSHSLPNAFHDEHRTGHSPAGTASEEWGARLPGSILSCTFTGISFSPRGMFHDLWGMLHSPAFESCSLRGMQFLSWRTACPRRFKNQGHPLTILTAASIICTSQRAV